MRKIWDDGRWSSDGAAKNGGYLLKGIIDWRPKVSRIGGGKFDGGCKEMK